MRIRKREENGTVMLELSGDMHGGPDNMKLLDVIEELGEDGKLDTVIDLHKVNFIASNGLGILVRARSRYARFGGLLKLCGANPRVLSVLTVTRLDLLFDVHDTCKEALAAVES